MKKPSTPQLVYSSPTQLKSDFQSTSKFRCKTPSALGYIIAAAKKVTRVFRVFLPGKRKATSNGAAPDDASKRNIQVKHLSYQSTGSYTTNSYASSGSISGQFAAVNFSFEEIYKATEKFSAANIIGEGGFGTVYKGKLKDGSIVAAKRAKKNKYDKHTLQEFKNEILTLSKIEHLNLVKLFGYLEKGDEKIIVVEYVGNGNLREHLDGKRGNGLETAERLDIAIDVAHALTYLHTYSDPPIIHRDIKGSNILITEKLRGKVADFGFARMAEEDPTATHISTQIKGTAGYLDPEYLRTYQLTEKSDVYSFGVLLVEIITGRYPIEPNKPSKERVTIRWAIQNSKRGEAILVMDPRLKRTPASTMAVEKILKLAHECLLPLRQSRPTMKKCAEVLWGIRREFREISLSSSSSTAPTSHHSSDYPHRDVKKNTQTLFGIEDDDTYKFISA